MLLFRSFVPWKNILRSNSIRMKPQITLVQCNSFYHILTKPKITLKCKRRCFYNWFKKPSQNELKVKDKISPEYKLVYNTTLDKYMVLGQVATIIFGGVLLTQFLLTGELITTFNSVQITNNKEIVIYITALVICVVVIHKIISRVPIRIYKSPRTKQYIFVIRGVFPFSKNYFTCVANQLVKVQELSPLVPWKECTYKVIQGNQERDVVLMDYYFKRPAELNILLGYQKEEE